MAAAFTETLETDALGLGLINLSAITHVDIVQLEDLLPVADTDQSLVQITDMTPLPDSDTVSPEGTLKYISKYLVQYVPVKQTKPSSSNRVTGARILTSEECAQISLIVKKKEKEEKEVRRFAREQKKKESQKRQS